MAIIRDHQLNIMMFMIGICAVLALMTLIAKSPSSRKKSILALMEIAAMFLLCFERAAYIYRGNTTDFGFMMVRISNGMVFFLQIFIPLLVTLYLKDLLQNEGSLDKTPFFLRISEVLFGLGTVLIVISQFTDLYYKIDEANLYHRSSGFLFAYAIPFLIVVLQVLTIIKYRGLLNRGLIATLIAGISFPTVVSIIQIFYYGLSLTSISTVFVVILFYAYALNDLNRAVETARKNELESYKEAERREAANFEQTAEALANAIDAKDKYTHGHSTRVATISRQIAQEAGYPEKLCNNIYFSGLLHDVGKIGIPDEIINKEGKLTDEEFEHIKQHPVLGYHILSSIKQFPELSIGAHYHHERFDGKGYPEGRSGEDIPEMARIIGVADAYDAMSSTRSYRSKLSEEIIREELIRGRGAQFDPQFADILVKLIDENRIVDG